MPIQNQQPLFSFNNFPREYKKNTNNSRPTFVDSTNSSEKEALGNKVKLTDGDDASLLDLSLVLPIKDSFSRLSFIVGLMKKFGVWFVSQLGGWSNPNEDAGVNNGNCGFASLAMIYKMFGGKCSPGKIDSFLEHLRELCGASKNEQDGSTMDLLETGAKKLGLNAESTTRDINQLAQGIAQGKKYILGIDPEKLYSDTLSSGHAIALLDINLNRGYAVIGDPGNVGGPRRVPLSALGDAMAASDNSVLEVSSPKNRTLLQTA